MTWTLVISEIFWKKFFSAERSCYNKNKGAWNICFSKLSHDPLRVLGGSILSEPPGTAEK